jgi:hypothetical protein
MLDKAKCRPLATDGISNASDLLGGKISVQNSHTPKNKQAATLTAELHNSDRCRKLFIAKRRTPAAIIVADDIWPGQWRIVRPDGSLSDHVNATRAKEAALDQAEAAEARKTPHKSPLKTLQNFLWSASPVRKNGSAYAEAWINWPAATDGIGP